jgi:hypothetical protein
VPDPDFEQPGLAPLRAAASEGEFAEAFRRLLSAGGCPLAPLARHGARSLIEAGFPLRHRDRHDRLCRLGGACPAPIPAGPGAGRSGIAVSRATRNLLLPGGDRYGSHHHTRQLMNAAPGGVPRGFGYPVQPPGTGGARLVSGHRDQWKGAGR